MNIVGVGDLLIPENFIREGFRNFEQAGASLKTISWKLGDYEELQNINLLIETRGSEAYEVPDDILEAVRDADIIITQFCPINRRVLDACSRLKAIGVLRGGIENVNLPYASERGVAVFHTPGRNANAVADFTVGMILAECRNIAKSHLNLKNGQWVRDYNNKDSVPDLADKVAGIVGFGEIGRRVAKRLAGFNMKIVAYDPFVQQAPDGVKMLPLEKLMQVSDFVTVHARLTEETEHLVSAEMLDLMKPTAYLINTARSGLVDENALCEALKEKKIMGAAIDVFDEEPPRKGYPLIELENITVTPHLAGGTRDAFTSSPKLLAAEMIKLLEGTDSRFVLNPDVYRQQFQKK
ncbi:2-hydroxyacid dehydrogenase [Clostridium sp. KNHs216]|uniref:2-hydroxyacid dehydrogenase n=1 Tax=Clostridium sp. KNHs216 TaxID=1550235 RepID=UPI001151F715|nr:2-hydroxyacid dehydrogenase [Clostridium sp. KNHs216]TQI68331.1 D-3-phosphoglycerate dehydrogenase [Clostridium sp. KNHs216]